MASTATSVFASASPSSVDAVLMSNSTKSCACSCSCGAKSEDAHLRTTRQGHSLSLPLPLPDSPSSTASSSSSISDQAPHLRRATTGDLMFNDAPPKDRLDYICDYLNERTNDARPLVGIVCGSGLGGLSKCLENPLTVKYEDIPQFPKSTVEGHAGELVFGELFGMEVICMRGRFHSYEGYEMRETALPIRVMYMLGIKYLIVTNAAGGLNPDYNVGDLMIMNDHLNMPGLAGRHPLVGPNDARFGERFTPLTNCYDHELQDMAFSVAERLGLAHKVRRGGVYCFVSGPTYETPTECKLLRLVGGDSVGMSTVPEVIVAVHCGIKVLGLSLITNKVIYPGSGGVPPSHLEVLEATQATQRYACSCCCSGVLFCSS